MTDEEMMELYPPWLFPELYPELFPDYVPAPASDPPLIDVADPTLTPGSDPAVIATPPPEQVPADPVQETSPVISLDELGQLLDQLRTADDEPDPSEELSVNEAAIGLGDVVAIELDPGTLALIDAVRSVKTELVLISDQIAELQLALDDKPMLTTPFEYYTVTEGLLLLLLLSAFIAACARMLRGGFSWLRS